MANSRYTVTKEGQSVTVRALRHIKEGEHLNIDYTNPLLGHLVRICLYQSCNQSDIFQIGL